MTKPTDGKCQISRVSLFFFFERITFWHPLWAGLADSGYYMDVNIFTPLKRYVVTEQNATALLNQEPGGSADRGWGFDQQMGKNVHFSCWKTDLRDKSRSSVFNQTRGSTKKQPNTGNLAKCITIPRYPKWIDTAKSAKNNLGTPGRYFVRDFCALHQLWLLVLHPCCWFCDDHIPEDETTKHILELGWNY